MQKEAVGLKARLDALNEISGENMRRYGVDRAILNGKVQLLAKMAVLASANANKVHKSTCTNTENYIDIPSDENVVQMITKVVAVS